MDDQQAHDALKAFRDPDFKLDGGIASVHGHHDAPSIRRFEHDGHEVVIETTYRVTIDGKEFEDQLMVRPDGSVHYHGLPQYSSPSAVELMKVVVERLNDELPPRIDATAAVYRDHEDHGGH